MRSCLTFPIIDVNQKIKATPQKHCFEKVISSLHCLTAHSSMYIPARNQQFVKRTRIKKINKNL